MLSRGPFLSAGGKRPRSPLAREQCSGKLLRLWSQKVQAEAADPASSLWLEQGIQLLQVLLSHPQKG